MPVNAPRQDESNGTKKSFLADRTNGRAIATLSRGHLCDSTAFLFKFYRRAKNLNILKIKTKFSAN